MKTVTSKENLMGQILLSQLSYGILLSLALTFSSATTLAAGGSEGSGPGSGGGGKGVVCRDSKGAVQSVELLDLWEARVLYKRTILKSNAPVEIQIKEGISRLKDVASFEVAASGAGNRYSLSADRSELLRETTFEFMDPRNENISRLRKVKLSLTPDSFEEAVPEDCAVEQLVQYKDIGHGGGSPHILVNQDLIDKLDSTNLTALCLHEALYKELRKYREKTSIRTRRAIGFVMAGNKFKSIDNYLQGPQITCTTEFHDSDPTVIHFVTYEGLTIIVPEVIKGVPMMGFEPTSSGLAEGPAKVFTRFGEQGWGNGVGMTNSPVDFDMSADLKVRLQNDQVTITLLDSASGNKDLTSENLNCKYFDK